MCRLKSQLSFALVTFVIGLLAVSFWIIKSKTYQCLENEREHNQTTTAEILTPVKELENSKEEYFHLSEDEIRLGIYHKLRPRSEYSNLLGQLSEFAELFGKSKKNTFYISKTETDNNKDFWVYVYWKEDKSILILYPPFDKEDGTYYNYFYSKKIDLVRDVVPTEKEVGTTNYLVSKSWANFVISKCISSSNKITIEKGR